MHYKAKLQNAFFESVLFRGSREDPAYVTEDGFQVIQFKRGEDTDFGIQGLVQIWCGNPTEEDLENTPDDDWGARAFFFGYQTTLAYFSMPTINADMEELIVYVPSSDWSSHEERVVERHYFERSKWVMDLGDLDQSNFLYQVLRNSWQMTPMTPSEIFNHLGEQFL